MRQELKETYSAIEEAKADVSGLWALKQLADKPVMSSGDRGRRCTRPSSPPRSARSGSAINEAHGRGIAIQLNYFLDAGAFKVHAGRHLHGRHAQRCTTPSTALTREIMTLQAEGSYAKAKALIDRLGVMRPEVKQVLDRLTDVPVDIEPRFTTADILGRQ